MNVILKLLFMYCDNISNNEVKPNKMYLCVSCFKFHCVFDIGTNADSATYYLVRSTIEANLVE